MEDPKDPSHLESNVPLRLHDLALGLLATNLQKLTS